MLKKTITYQDLDGKDVTEDFYFHFNKAELAEMEMSKSGGMMKYLTEVVASEDGAAIIESFKMILAKSYGRRSANNRSFIKDDEFTNEFFGTDAYSKLFVQLVTDANFATEFINGVMPSDLVKEVQAETKNATISDTAPAWIQENRDPTQKEIASMTHSQLAAAMQRKVAPR